MTDETQNPCSEEEHLEFTLSGWVAQVTASDQVYDRRLRRLGWAYLTVGGPCVLCLVVLLVVSESSFRVSEPLGALAVLALIAQYFPVQVSHTNVSIGVGFFLAGTLYAGPLAGAAAVSMVYLIWAMTRELLPWFSYTRAGSTWLRMGRAIYAAGVSGVAYYVAAIAAFHFFAVEVPVAQVNLATVGASVVLTVGVYLLQNAASFALMVLSGDNVGRLLRTSIPLPALAEFVALPASLLLVVVQVRLGSASFALLAWLYLMASFLGWRSWQDRESLKRRLDEVEILHRSTASLSGTLELTELVRRFWAVLSEVAPFRRMLLVVSDPAESLHQVFAFDAHGQRAELGASAVHDTEARPEGLFVEPGGSFVYVKDMALGDDAWARLRLDFPAGREPPSQQRAMLATICQQAASATANARLYRLANTDRLTGVAIRRYFERALRQTARRGVPYAVVILDLDWFKRINDTFGHRTGDLVLQDLATVLKGTLRAMDVAARFGGEEFVILLPSASSPEAAAVAERLRRQVEAKRLTIEGQMVRYTASFGVAASDDLSAGADAMDVVWKADAALLEAKRAGRNQTITYSALVHHSGPEPKP